MQILNESKLNLGKIKTDGANVAVSPISCGGFQGGQQGHCRVLLLDIMLLAHFVSLPPSLPPTFLGKYSFHTLFFPCRVGSCLEMLWLSCHGDLLAAEEIVAILCCYLYGTYPPILQLASFNGDFLHFFRGNH